MCTLCPAFHKLWPSWLHFPQNRLVSSATLLYCSVLLFYWTSWLSQGLGVHYLFLQLFPLFNFLPSVSGYPFFSPFLLETPDSMSGVYDLNIIMIAVYGGWIFHNRGSIYCAEGVPNTFFSRGYGSFECSVCSILCPVSPLFSIVLRISEPCKSLHHNKVIG